MLPHPTNSWPKLGRTCCNNQSDQPVSDLLACQGGVCQIEFEGSVFTTLLADRELGNIQGSYFAMSVPPLAGQKLFVFSSGNNAGVVCLFGVVFPV